MGNLHGYLHALLLTVVKAWSVLDNFFFRDGFRFFFFYEVKQACNREGGVESSYPMILCMCFSTAAID